VSGARDTHAKWQHSCRLSTKCPYLSSVKHGGGTGKRNLKICNAGKLILLNSGVGNVPPRQPLREEMEPGPVLLR
jgi:hypothetical protein